MKQYSKPSLFKDYNKSTSDILTKNYNNADFWKLEGKARGSPNSFIINPKATSKGDISTDVEYIAECGGSIKVNITPACLENMKVTGSYGYKGHQFEAFIHRKGDDFDFEICHETCVILNKRASMNEKITKKAIELGLGVDVAPNCQVGCGATYNIAANDCNWHFGCRYADKGREIAFTTNRMKKHYVSASTPIDIPISGKSHRVMLAAGTACSKGEFLGTVGIESKCFFLPKNTIKLRVDTAKEWAASYIVKMAECWTMAVSIDKNCKAGVLLTHN